MDERKVMYYVIFVDYVIILVLLNRVIWNIYILYYLCKYFNCNMFNIFDGKYYKFLVIILVYWYFFKLKIILF